MPSGKTHQNLEFFFLPAVVAGGIYVDQNIFSIEKSCFPLFVGAYLFSTLFLSPDLDLRKCDSRKNWGALGILWEPYSRLFAHRGLSHSLIWGTSTRIIYLLALSLLTYSTCALFFAWPVFDGHRLWQWMENHSLECLTIYLGLYLPNLIHTLADRVS